MPRAAIPDYIPSAHLTDSSPGLRFGLYLQLWTTASDQQRELQERAGEAGEDKIKSRTDQKRISRLKEQCGVDGAIHHLVQEGDLAALWAPNKYFEKEIWSNITTFQPAFQNFCGNLNRRQHFFLDALPEIRVWSCQAVSHSPFTTGLGNEHPLENGFSFLNPYGLPYLAGSGVKGVVREAARQLAEGQWAESHGWHKEHVGAFTASSEGEKTTIRLTALDVLFGRETPSGESDHFRGVLSFWDVIPEIEGDKLRVEVMTPHQSHYYQQNSEPKTGNRATPHDSGQPNPILFLTVPPGSRFTFHVVCDEVRLRKVALELAEGEKWKRLLEAAFEHAFTWLGFGAKTAVGYGAMKRSDRRPAPVPQVGRDREQQQRAPAPASSETVWEKATLRWDPSKKELTATLGSQKTAPLRDKRAEDLINKLPENEREILKSRKSVPNRPVKVRAEGNKVEIVDLA
jgi:CRISPR-associated protein Cmr6